MLLHCSFIFMLWILFSCCFVFPFFFFFNFIAILHFYVQFYKEQKLLTSLSLRNYRLQYQSTLLTIIMIVIIHVQLTDTILLLTYYSNNWQKFYKATISNPYHCVFWLIVKWCSFRRVFSFVVSGMWEPENIGQGSTFRELNGIYFALLIYVAQLKHKRVKIFTDNQGAARIVTFGSSKINLQALAMDNFNLCPVKQHRSGSAMDPKVA